MTGIDIVQLSRIRLDQPLIHKILTEKEQSHPDWQISIAHDGDYAIAIVIIP